MKSKAHTLLMIATFVLIVNGCGNSSKLPVSVVSAQDNSTAKLTITKVKKPWYAPQFFVVNKMKASVPQYRQIKGLKEKNYAFSRGTQYFGGIYHWESKAEAKAWFNEAWFKNIKDKYGVDGIVEYYEVLEKIVYLKVTEENQVLWAVLSQNAADVSKKRDLVEVMRTKDETGKVVTFSLWVDESKAQQYLEQQSNATLMLLPATIYRSEE